MNNAVSTQAPSAAPVIDPTKMSMLEISTLASVFNAMQAMLRKQESDVTGPWKIGEKYMVRTVTFTNTGIITAVYPDEIVMEKASWIPDTGRFSKFANEGISEEVEPFKQDQPIIIGRGSIVDAQIVPILQTEQK